MSSIAPQCYDCSCYMKACHGYLGQPPHSPSAHMCYQFRSMGLEKIMLKGHKLRDNSTHLCDRTPCSITHSAILNKLPVTDHEFPANVLETTHCQEMMSSTDNYTFSVADPGFPVWGAWTRWGAWTPYVGAFW